jgi:hypothetical protein
MPNEIYSELSDLFADTLIAQQIAPDGQGTGDVTNVGESVAFPAKLSGKDRTVKSAGGQEIVSNVNFIVGPSPVVNATYWRFTLPARYSSRENLKAVAVKHVSDENGIHHQVVMFGSGTDVD